MKYRSLIAATVAFTLTSFAHATEESHAPILEYTFVYSSTDAILKLPPNSIQLYQLDKKAPRGLLNCEHSDNPTLTIQSLKGDRVFQITTSPGLSPEKICKRIFDAADGMNPMGRDVQQITFELGSVVWPDKGVLDIVKTYKVYPY